MFNDLSMQAMINTGQFGNTAPQFMMPQPQMYGYPNQQMMYANMGYPNQQMMYGGYPNQPMQMPMGYPTQQPMQQMGYPNNNGYVFQPLNQQPVMQQQTGKVDCFDPYGYYANRDKNQNNNLYNNYRNPVFQQQPMYQQPTYQQYDTYNQSRYMTTQQEQNPIRVYFNPLDGYDGYRADPYAYNPYSSPFITPQQRRELEAYVNMMTLKHRIVDSYFGRTTDVKAIERRYNPNYHKATNDEQQTYEEFKYISWVAQTAIPATQSEIAMRDRDRIIAISTNNHREFDNHSLFQFLNDDLWKLEREAFLRENLTPKADRDLSSMYDSDDYNRLVQMHMEASGNPYAKALLDNTRYDNNLDDIEMGMAATLDRARRKKAILEGKVPEFISSSEVQDRRNKFINHVLEMMYKKNGGAPPDVKS